MTRPGYKMTEIGEIPEEWETSELRKTFKIITGTTPSTKIKKYWTGGTIEWLTPKDLSQMNDNLIISPSERKVTTDALNESNLNLLPEGSILMSTRAPVGYVGINRAPIAFNQGCKGLVPLVSEGYSSFFYAYYLKYKREFLNSVSSGSTFKELSKERLERLVVPIPPWLEQQKIAEILSTADETIQKVNDQITQTERLKKGLMQTLLTKGIGHTKFKMTGIGEIPEEWGIKALSDSCFSITDGSHYSPQEVKGGTRLIATVFNMDNNRIITEMCKRISDKDYDLLVKNGCKPDKGDVLFSKDGTVGVSFPYFQKDNIVLLSSIAILKPSDILDSTFLSYFLKSENGMRQIIGLKTGSALKRITLKNLKLVKIPVPSYKEQQKIAEILSTVDHKLELLRNKKTHLEELKKGLMEDLLTGRVRVKIETSKGEN